MKLDAVRAARLVLNLAAIEAKAARRLTPRDAEDHSRMSRLLTVATRRLGIEPTPRRLQKSEDDDAGAITER